MAFSIFIGQIKKKIFRVCMKAPQGLKGAYQRYEPPLPIPNRALKAPSTEGTAFTGGRERGYGQFLL
jgi:hypothetical protein